MPWVIILVFILVFFSLLWMFPLIVVNGISMNPTYSDGEYLLGIRKIRKKPDSFKINEIYVYQPPGGDKRYVIKRLIEITSFGLIFAGDNRDNSYDSRHYGYVNPNKVVAKVIYRKRV
jgi:signal peptidase I